MKKPGSLSGWKIGLAIAYAFVTMSQAAFADEGKTTVPIVSADDVRKAIGLSIYLQAAYTYNANASSTGTSGLENDLRRYDHEADSFVLDLAEVLLSRDPAVGLIGYKVKVSMGETAKLIHARGLGSQPTGTANPESIDITEAYITYTAPIGRGLRLDFGKMGTFIGAESLEAIDNPNYSRSFLYTYAEPTTHTGLKASYAVDVMMSASVYLVNGWDNATENNSAKSVGLSLHLTPSEVVSGYFNYLFGPEQDNNTGNSRELLDLVAIIRPTQPLSIILNYDNAREKREGPDAPDAMWNGISGIVKYDFTETYGIAFRGETFHDRDGLRTGTAQRLMELTVTPEVRLAGGLILRPEYRFDMSNRRSFSNGTKKTQDTFALAAMYRW